MRPLFAVAILASGALALAVVLFFDTATVRKHKLEPQARHQQQQQQPQQLEQQPQESQHQMQRPQPVEAAKLDLPSAVPSLPRELGTRPGLGSESHKTDQVKIKYTVPRNTIHRRIHERLKEERALETLREFLSPFRLPRKLTVMLEECDGDPNASYEDDSISICYEYIDELWRRAPTDSTKGDVAPIDAIIGPLFDTALHEFAHALFDMHKLPVFGREEDAADQVAAYITLHLNKAEARRLILGTAYAYKNEIAAEKRPRTTRQFANVHSTPAQRLYNLLCLAYGSDSKVFSDLVGKSFLPKSRAEDCEDEYKQVERAYETLIGPFIDRGLERKVMNKRWLPDSSTHVQPRPSRQGQARLPPASQTARKLKSSRHAIVHNRRDGT